MLRPIVLTLLLFTVQATAQEKTVVNDKNAARTLLGRHTLSLQWISWDYFGTADVINASGVYRLKGEQKGRGQSKEDYLTIDGVVTSIDTREFKFDGKIEMRVSHINNGEPCLREGEFMFAITGKRKYWRMREMDNPCDEATDYVDIHFR